MQQVSPSDLCQTEIKSVLESNTLHLNKNIDSEADDIWTSCSHCRLPICDRRNIKCDLCSSTFHQKCTTIPVKVFDKFVVFIDITGWVCESCRRTVSLSHRRLEAAVAHLANELATVKSMLEELRASQSQHNIPGNEYPSTVSAVNDQEDDDIRTTLIIHRTLSDNARLKQNVIVTGLPESDSANED